MAYVQWREEGSTCSFKKVFDDDKFEALLSAAGAEKGDILFFVADRDKTVFAALGALRLAVAKKYNLIDEKQFDILWVTEFPLYEYDEEEKR